MSVVLLPALELHWHDGFIVVRDDLLPGGTKRRAIAALFDEHDEYVYASPAYGYAQLALAYAAQDAGKQATIFVAHRKQLAPLSLEAQAAGAKLVLVPHGYLNVVSSAARMYAATRKAKLLPFGLDDPTFIRALAEVARQVPAPEEAWCALGSGTLVRALALAWPETNLFAVRVGAHGNAGRAEVIEAPEKYERAAEEPPPFPSCKHYDAKVWRFMKEQARPGALMWNVGA